MAQAPRKIKRSGSSLNGAFIVGIAVVVLAMLITGELGWTPMARWAVSLVIGIPMGIWVGAADL